MTILLFDGFDIYPNIDSTSNGLQASWAISNVNMSIVAGRFGGQAISCNAPGSYGAYFYKGISATSTATGAFAANLTAWTVSQSDYQIMNFMGDGNQLCGIGYTASQNLYLWVSSSTTGKVATSTITITPDSWHYYELEVNIGSSGSINLYVDGLLAITYSGNTGTTNIDRITYGMPNYGNYATWAYDDVYCTDSATRLGERRVQPLVPASDGTVSWTPSAGSTNYNCVDSLPAPAQGSQTAWVYTSTVGDQDLYNVTPLDGSPTAISAVQVKICASKDDSATRTLAPVIHSGSTTSVGDTAALTQTFLYYQKIYETDPNTSSAWTKDTVNAMEIGQKVIS